MTIPIAMEAIRYHFQWVNDTLRRMERMRVEAEPRHLDALLQFAARAYRRPLSPAERDDVLAYYRTLREKSGLDARRGHARFHRQRADVAQVLLSRRSAGRFRQEHRGAGHARSPAYALASRLELLPVVQHAR